MKRLTNMIKLGFQDSDRLSSYMALWDRLKYYEDMEEQGKLLALPCKVGDIVWCITSDQYDYIVTPIECTVNEISVNIDNSSLLLFRIDSNDSTDGWADMFPNMRIPNHMNVRRIDDFGKTIFPSKEIAESKLKEMTK